jgi:hypothetical protein
MYGLDVWVSIHCKGRDFSLRHLIYSGSGDCPPLSGDPLPGLVLQGQDDEHSRPSSALRWGLIKHIAATISTSVFTRSNSCPSIKYNTVQMPAKGFDLGAKVQSGN